MLGLSKQQRCQQHPEVAVDTKLVSITSAADNVYVAHPESTCTYLTRVAYTNSIVELRLHLNIALTLREKTPNAHMRSLPPQLTVS